MHFDFGMHDLSVSSLIKKKEKRKKSAAMDLAGLGAGKVPYHRTFQRHSTAKCDGYCFDSATYRKLSRRRTRTVPWPRLDLGLENKLPQQFP